MIKFHTITLADKPWVDEIVAAENSRSADFNFGNIYMWDKKFKQLIARCDGRMLTKLRYGGAYSFAFPIGSGPLEGAMEAIEGYAARRGWTFRLRGITEENRELLEKCYPGKFVYSEDTDCFDYIYRAESLATYSGKAMHGKKNHCNRFEKENEWQFIPLTRPMIPQCMDMLDTWREDNAGRLDSSVTDEHDAIIRAFAAYEDLGLEGGILTVGGETVGFSIGEKISSDTFNVHFEKARIDINGAYPMVCREFTKQVLALHPEVKYINREDDMGLEPLRISKLSYKPEFMVKKYSAVYAE